MLRKERLFTPGPTPLLPAAQLALASAGMHHRTAEFRALYRGVLAGLQTFIGTRNDVLMLAASGTGAMEAAVANLTSPGERVLVLTAGKFGERWRDLARAYGCEVDVVSVPYGETFSLDAVRAQLSPQTRAVFVQATESSTGARHDVRAIADILRGSDSLLIVDAITGLGTTTFDVDAWNIGVIIGGSQKALMAPPGVAYLAVSERAWQRMEQGRSPRYYFDLRRERQAAAKGESAYTPAIAVIAALGAALDYLRTVGDGDLAAGRDLLIANAEAAAALTAIAAPSGLDSSNIVRAFRERFGAHVANGQGEMKGKLFRIAHIGYYDYLDTIGVIAALEQVLAGLGVEVQLGTGVRAAQDVFARSAAVGATAP